MSDQSEQAYMRECEAREWIRRFRNEGLSRAQGQARINKLIFDVEKIRGKKGAEDLRLAIQRELRREKEARP